MDRADVLILGGGPVGLALASALDSSGLSAILVDPADPEGRATQAFDGRTSAVSSSSMRMLETIGVADHFPEAGCPIRTIQVADGLHPGGLAFDPDDSEPPPDDQVTVTNGDGSIGVTEFAESLDDGEISHGWCVADGDPIGRHRIRVFIGDQMLQEFRFEVVEETY